MLPILSPAKLAGSPIRLDPSRSQAPRRQIDPWDRVETAAMRELVAQRVGQRPFSPILPLKSKIQRNSNFRNRGHRSHFD